MLNIPTTLVINCLILGVILLQPFSLTGSGQFDQITHRDQRISVSYQTLLNNAERESTYFWLQQVAETLLTIYGEFPKDYFHITIKRSSNRASPVPWGHVERGNPTNVVLVINPEFGFDELISDWTAFHELSHLLLPYRGYGNIWFSEGLATYYQNIIQARNGMLDERELWHNIVAGFERGIKELHWDHLNLTEVSDRLGETRQYMRVHWSGALYWLSADITLRRQNKGTLDNALKRLKECCESHSMSAKAIADKLDLLNNVNVFIPLFYQFSQSHRLPEYRSILAELGVKQNNLTTDIILDDVTSLAKIRRQIGGNVTDM